MRVVARSNDLTASIWNPGSAHVPARERFVLSGGDAGVFLRAVPARPSLSCLSLPILKSPVELRLCSVGPRSRQCAVRLPPSASSSVVESSQPDDGGRSATLLLVAFPLPSRSLLAGPDAAISPRTHTKNRLVFVAVPPKNRTAGIFRTQVTVRFARRGASYLPFVIVIRYTCEFASQVPVDVKTVDFMRD